MNNSTLDKQINKILQDLIDFEIERPEAREQLKALILKTCEEVKREIEEDMHEVYYSTNAARSVLTENDRLEIRANNDAVRRCIEILNKDRP